MQWQIIALNYIYAGLGLVLDVSGLQDFRLVVAKN